MIKPIQDSEILNNLCKEFNISLPRDLQERKIYKEITQFKDAEYIYCIAYELLVRTEEYNKLLNAYEIFEKSSSKGLKEDEFIHLNKLIEHMNRLGLNKSSFLGFRAGKDGDHVFKKIKHYNHPPSNQLMIDMFKKLKTEDDNNIYYNLIKFYNNKNELFIWDAPNKPIQKTYNQEDMKILKKDLHLNDKCNLETLNSFLNYTGIYLKKTEFKLLKELYLEDLDKDFLSTLKESQNKDLLIKVLADYTHNNNQFWYKYAVNDIKDGLEKLIEFYIKLNDIYDKNGSKIDLSKPDAKTAILNNPADFYIPSINRTLPSKKEEHKIEAVNNYMNDFYIKMKNDGHKLIIRKDSYSIVQEQNSTYLVAIHKYLPLFAIEDSFLESIEYEDLKNCYIETEPIFSRPRLMFNEARLTKIPINLNLSKEDLLFYIAEIKDEYDKNKNIVKNDIEYFFNLPLESDLAKQPSNIKLVDQEVATKRHFPNKRNDLKERFSYAFYIYDLYKFFIPICAKKQKKLEKEIQAQMQGKNKNQIKIIKEDSSHEIKSYSIESLTTEISKLVQVSEEEVKTSLTVMKEYIHGINRKDENDIFKKKYDSNKYETLKSEEFKPKYKNLIIGNSYISKSKKDDLIKKLLG